MNTASSLGYVVAGLDLLRRPDPDRPFAWAVIGVGVGSVALHGPGGRAGKWLHDSSLIAMLGLLALTDVTVAEGRAMPPAAVAGVVVGSLAAGHPSTTDAAQAATGAVAIAAEAARIVRGGHRVEPAVRLPLFAAGALLHAFGRTGGPLCRPDARLQPHAGWHLLSAAALWSRRRF